MCSRCAARHKPIAVHYFSPQILDGSVTTVKVADGAVSYPKLDTSTATQAGTIVGGTEVVIAMASYSFAPAIVAENPQVAVISNVQPVPDAHPDFPTFGLRNPTGIDYLYSTAWRYVDV